MPEDSLVDSDAPATPWAQPEERLANPGAGAGRTGWRRCVPRAGLMVFRSSACVVCYGRLLGLVVRGGALAARSVFDQLELIWRATDLGRVKSVAAFPAIPPISSRARSAGKSPISRGVGPPVGRRRASRRHHLGPPRCP